MQKLESLGKAGARIQPLSDGSVLFRTSETSSTTSTPMALPPPQMPQIQVKGPMI
jgi:hypothetical protein